MTRSGPGRRLLLGSALATPFIRTAAAAEPLTLWHEMGDFGARWFSSLAEQFAQSHPGFTLRRVSYQTEQWYGRAVSALTTDNAPDLLFNNYERIAVIAAQTGKVMDLAPTLKGMSDKYFLTDDDMRLASYRGKIIMLPVQRAQMALGVRKTWLDHAGERFPVTWDDAKRIAGRFRENPPGGAPKPTCAFALEGLKPRELIHMLDLFMVGAGLHATLIDPAGQVTIDEPAHATVLEEFLKVYTSYGFAPPGAVNNSFADMYRMIEGGHAGMFRVGDWNVAKWDRQFLDGDFALGPWPKFFPDMPGGVVTGGMRGVAVPENAPNKALALEFAAFMLNRTSQQASLAILGQAVRDDLDLSGMSERQRFFAHTKVPVHAYDFPETMLPWYPALEATFHRALVAGITQPPDDWKPFIAATAADMRTAAAKLAEKKT